MKVRDEDEDEDEDSMEAAAAGCKRRGSTPCAVEVGADAENAAKPVFKLSGVCVSRTAGAAALSVMLMSGTVLPWGRRSNVSTKSKRKRKRRPTKPRQSQCRPNVFSRGS